MYSISTGLAILILIIGAPFYFWYIYLSVLLMGILLLYFNRKKQENQLNRFYYKIGKLLIGFVSTSLIMSLISLWCFFRI